MSDSLSSTVISSQDSLIVYHGSACAKSNKDGTEDIIKIEGSKELPSFATNATVFLNGWNLEYLNSDHHVSGVGAVISKIKLEESVTRTKILKWEATGVLTDDNFDDGYSFCYNYTIIAWRDNNVNLIVDHDDGSCSDEDAVSSNLFSSNNEFTTTALSSYSSFLNNPAFISSSSVAILPRGFGMGWSECGADHHLLQIAYNLDHNASFIKNQSYKKGSKNFNPSFPDNAARVDSGFVSWQSFAIFKDNSGRRGYEFGEIVSGLSGTDLSVIDPPYTILPTEDDCDGGVGQTNPEEVVIKNIPYKYAIPILTGWDMGYLCNDEHIKKAGVWIESWSYTKDPVTGMGTLIYKLNSNFSDKNSDNSNYRTHKVTLLGIKPILPGKIASESSIDLVPIVPPGAPTNSFCRRDTQGNVLFVTIKNQGTADAGMSATTVEFGNQKVNVNTPPIKAGESVELQFSIPGNCYDPVCEFTIIADSQKQIDEGSSEMNNIVSAICQRVIL
ncbi:MAG: CARDB domain-containing protein [Ignavibacteria bacterium]